MTYLIALVVLFLVLFAQEYISDHQDDGWGIVVRPAVISVAWMIAAIAAQDFGTIGWFVGMVLLVGLITEVKGYSVPTAIFFVLVISIVLYGGLLLSGEFQTM